MNKLKDWAKKLKTNIFALYLASKDPRIPTVAKLMILVTVAYALSPVDLIPDFIPVLGYLDDLILVPIGIWFAIKLIPEDIWQECVENSRVQNFELPKNRISAAIIILIWLSLLVVFIVWLIR